MKTNRRNLIKKALATTVAASLPSWLIRPVEAVAAQEKPSRKVVPDLPDTAAEPGPFQPTWESLAAYKCPEWFRDAKFGIWAHWSGQCVPEQGDWYARGMYEQVGAEPWCTGDYAYQCSHYGHPSKVGFKEIDNLWTTKNWDPERLIDLYHRAGAQYFVALGNHHDNFDTWDSKYQPWNAVNIGPQRDIIATWKDAARKRGMKFGVTIHAGRTWDWFDVAHGSDKTGPLAGVPYDGVLTEADGAGKWWEGYDPAELYGPARTARTPEAMARYELKFYNRVMDVMDQHQPDLVYFDDWEPPTRYGMHITANFYNKSLKWHDGKNEAVLNCKNPAGHVKKSMVLDYERGSSDRIAHYPWQTDTCIGSWHYQRSIYENHQYKTPDQVVRMLVDIVSKNGNLLLNIPVRGDGTIDPDEEAFLVGFTSWMDINRQSIFATRPWTISGEGANHIGSGGAFSEGGTEKLTETDFRFVTKGKTLYATSFGWPTSGKYRIRTLAAGATGIVGDVNSVSLLGHTGELSFSRTADGLEVSLPLERPCDHAFALKIGGLDLDKSDPSLQQMAPAIGASPDGSFNLKASSANLNGSLVLQGTGDAQNVGFWDDSSDDISWRVSFEGAGQYTISARFAANDTATSIEVVIDNGIPSVIAVPVTGDWNKFVRLTGTPITVSGPGIHTVTVKPADGAMWHPVNFAEMDLVPVASKLVANNSTRLPNT